MKEGGTKILFINPTPAHPAHWRFEIWSTTCITVWKQNTKLSQNFESL